MLKYSTMKNLLDALYAFADECPSANIYWDEILHTIEEMQNFKENDTSQYEAKQFQRACVAKYMHEELSIDFEDMAPDSVNLIKAYADRMLD